MSKSKEVTLAIWLPVRYRIIFKILVWTYQSYHGVAPDYMCEIISKQHNNNVLRYNGMMLLDEPKIKGTNQSKMPSLIRICGSTRLEQHIPFI